MKYILLTFFSVTFSTFSTACDYIDSSSSNDINELMGKKSKFYDTYRQGKCALDEALKNLPLEQRKVIANIISKTYNINN